MLLFPRNIAVFGRQNLDKLSKTAIFAAIKTMQNNNAEKATTPTKPTGRLTFKKVVINLLKLALGVLAIYIIVQKVDLQKVTFYIKQANWAFLFLAFLSFFVSKTIAALRINCYYRTQDLQLSEWLNFKLSLLGMFYNLFMPLIGGEGYKIYWLRRNYKTPTKKLIAASLLDRVSGLAVLLGLALLVLQFTSLSIPFKPLAVLAIFVLFGVYFLIHNWFFNSFQSAWWKVTGYSLIVQILQVTTTFFILLALNVDSHVMDYLFIFLLSCMAYVLPFIGAREMAFVFGATAMGLDPDLSLTISLFFYLALAITSLSGIYFLLFPKQLEGDSRV